MSEKNYDRRAVLSWCTYDFANSAFSSLVLTFVYSTYYAKVVAPDGITGTTYWSWGLTLSALIVGLTSPFIGAMAQRGGYRKIFLLILTAVAISATGFLYTVMPGQVVKGLVIFVVANIAIEMGMVIYNSFLPDIAPPDKIGRISGYGWAFGYFGGLIVMLLAFIGLIQTETPWFGFSTDASENVRASNLLVAIWMAVFCLPIFLWVKEKAGGSRRTGSLIYETLDQLKETFREVKKYRQIVRLLIARIFYNDGLLTIFSFGGIYAAETFGFTTSEILIFGIVLNIAAAMGAFAFGFLDDIFGGKKVIQFTNIALMITILIAVFAPSKPIFWISGIMLGILAGPNQAASRSLMGRFVPQEKESEFFGFYALSGKSTAFMGAFMFGAFTNIFQTQRAGVAVTLIFFIIGSLILTTVDEAAGKKASGRVGAADSGA